MAHFSATTHASQPEAPLFRIAYVTDVEGNLDYFHRFVELSGVLVFDETGPPRDAPDAVLTLAREDDHFVFGGDAV